MRRILQRTFLLSLALAPALLCTASCKKDDSLPKLPAANGANGVRQVRVMPLRYSEGTEEIRATGTVSARSTTKVMPLVPGLITHIPVREGDRVKKGQVLAQLDQRGFALGQRQAQAALEMAEVGVSAARRERDRFEELLRGEASSKAQVDQITDRYLGAMAGLKQAQVAVEMAKKAITDSTIRAPYDGIVVTRLASLGDYATSMPPTVLFILMETSTLELKISLPEPDLARISVGQEAEAQLTTVGRTVKGMISRIVSSVDPMTRSFYAIMEIPNADLSLEAGLFAKVRIQASGPRRQIVVPEEAVVDESSGVYVVYLADGRAARRRVVKVTESGAGFMELVEGARAAEQVILNPSGLSDGDPIAPSEEPRAAPAPSAAPAPTPAAGAESAGRGAGSEAAESAR